MVSRAFGDLDLKLGRRTTRDGLDSVPRARAREGLSASLPVMFGHDLWNAWEVSYLSPEGRPVVWHMQCVYAADTPCIVESKSFKLFLNARNQETYPNRAAFAAYVRAKLEACVDGSVELHFYAPETTPPARGLRGVDIDAAETPTFPDAYDPHVPTTQHADSRGFAFHSHLLRSLCPVTAQPDWGAVEIEGLGARSPSAAGLLAYIVGLRNHQDFHEVCCERIYADLYAALAPERLTVRCLYTRRGGLDIGPVRSSHAAAVLREPVWRQ